MNETDQWQAKWHGLQDVLGPKWALHILRLLSVEPHGFNAIRNELSGLRAPMLSKRLKELSCHGLVERTVVESTPPTTTYALTDKGEQIARHLRQLEPLVELHDRPAAEGQSAEPVADCRTEALTDRCLMVADEC